MRSFFQAVAILMVCAFVAIAAGNGVGGGKTPKSTPPVSGEAEAVQAVMSGLQPIIVSSAGAVDTLAEIADPTPSPTLFETWGKALSILCALGMVLTALSAVVILWLVIRSGVVMALIGKLE